MKEPEPEPEPEPIDRHPTTPDDLSAPASFAESEQWSEFAPSLMLLQSHSQQVVSAISKIGESIGEFEIIRILGEGAFGKVFLARQKSLDREVAVKITANVGTEGRTMARLEHAHIVQVYSESVDEHHGVRMLCMQFVPGATLYTLIARIRDLPRSQRDGRAILNVLDAVSTHSVIFDPAKLRDREVLAKCGRNEAVCWIGRILAEALAYAHRRNVLHRDIKPANVIVNQYGQPMLTDFNLSLPKTGAVHVGAAIFGGTIGYMAPEHIEALNPSGDVGPEVVDERSDIYSLGAVLLELLVDAKHTAGQKCTLDGHDIDKLVQSQRDIGQVSQLLDDADVAAPAAKIIRRCMDPLPQRRFQSASELADALSGGFQLLRIEQQLPSGGFWTRWASAQPFSFLLFYSLVPNVAASAVNIGYNILVVIQDLTSPQQTAFIQMVIWYNVVVIVIMLVMLDRTLLRHSVVTLGLTRTRLRTSRTLISRDTKQ